ncbi:hypothetical protein KY495_23305 [Massilia sp. PAMC28688]|uniref:hypothetical protein n=1 Tax=Massilia sp. PAMC28688 TaxID=2861283 RepID=UPI001C62BF24|nr:hypothetical protein [Massilia sp. PAMC28688]QYF93548.1 hypothetical protein KY495_23305 [Massilia sp. PAMC28688]
MASLSSKRKTFTNRQLQRRDTGRKAPAKVSAAIVAPAAAAGTAAPSAFDEAFYEAARSRFEAAVAACTSSDDVKQVMRAVVQQEFDAGGREAALQMRPYIIKFVGEHRDRNLAGAARP